MTETFQSVPLWMMVLGFLLVLGPLVTVHEFGHYLVGRAFGVGADAFSIGFGKEVAGWTDRRGTRWKLSALPLGGYVQFKGDMNPASQPDEEALDGMDPDERDQAFQTKPLWQRALIVAAGPVTNLLVAIAILAAFNLSYGRIEIPATVGGVEEDGAAAAAGIEAGDRIAAIDGAPINDFADLRNQVVTDPGGTITLEVVKSSGTREMIPFTIPTIVERDRFGNEFRIGRLGIASMAGERVDVGPIEAVGLATRQTVSMMVMMVEGIWQIISGRRPVSELGGPIKIAKFSGEQLSLGWPAFISFIALISLNLAFINLLPVPGLDGGHLAFYAAEAVRRRPASARSQEWAFRTGMAIVLALMLFVTVNDILSLPAFSG